MAMVIVVVVVVVGWVAGVVVGVVVLVVFVVVAVVVAAKQFGASSRQQHFPYFPNLDALISAFLVEELAALVKSKLLQDSQVSGSLKILPLKLAKAGRLWWNGCPLPEFMMYLSTDDFLPTSINTRWWWFVARWMFGFGMHKYSYLHYIYICIFTTSSDQMILTSRNLHGMLRTWIDLHLMTWHGRSSPPAPGEFLHLGYRLLSLRHQPVTCVRHKGMKRDHAPNQPRNGIKNIPYWMLHDRK